MINFYFLRHSWPAWSYSRGGYSASNHRNHSRIHDLRPRLCPRGLHDLLAVPHGGEYAGQLCRQTGSNSGIAASHSPPASPAPVTPAERGHRVDKHVRSGTTCSICGTGSHGCRPGVSTGGAPGGGCRWSQRSRWHWPRRDSWQFGCVACSRRLVETCP